MIGIHTIRTSHQIPYQTHNSSNYHNFERIMCDTWLSQCLKPVHTKFYEKQLWKNRGLRAREGWQWLLQFRREIGTIFILRLPRMVLPDIEPEMWNHMKPHPSATFKVVSKSFENPFSENIHTRPVLQSETLFTTQRSHGPRRNLCMVVWVVLKKRSRPGISAKNIRGRGKTVEHRGVQIRLIWRLYPKVEHSLLHIL